MLRSNEDVEMKDVEDEDEEVVSELDPDEGLFFGAYPLKNLTSKSRVK